MGRVGYSSVYLFPNTYVPLLIKLIIGQFDFVEGYYLSHPILTKSGRIGVNVHAAWHRRVCISRHYPLRTVISVSVDLRQHYYISQKNAAHSHFLTQKIIAVVYIITVWDPNKEKTFLLSLLRRYIVLVYCSCSCYYLSNRPQVSMVYKLIDHAGCW